MWHIGGIREKHTVFWLGKLKERHHLEDKDIEGRITLQGLLISPTRKETS